MRLHRLLPVVCLALAGLACLGPAAAPAVAADSSELDVIAYQTAPGKLDATEIDLSVASSAAATARATVYVPSGYGADLTAAPGTQLGTVSAALTGPSGDVTGTGKIVADDPAKYASQGCAPGTHAAIWVLGVTVAGQQLSIPVYVDPATPDVSSKAAYALQTCFTSPGASGLRLSEADLVLPRVFTNPAKQGLFVWRSLITPFDAAGNADGAGTTELQTVVALPHRVTLKGHFDARRRRVTLSGTVVAAGAPRAGINVHLYSAPSTAADVKPYATLRTGKGGAFTVTKPLAKTTYFLAVVNFYISTGGCQSAIGAAPCTRETIAPPEQAVVKVTVPKRTK